MASPPPTATTSCQVAAAAGIVYLATVFCLPDWWMRGRLRGICLVRHGCCMRATVGLDYQGPASTPGIVLPSMCICEGWARLCCLSWTEYSIRPFCMYVQRERNTQLGHGQEQPGAVSFPHGPSVSRLPIPDFVAESAIQTRLLANTAPHGTSETAAPSSPSSPRQGTVNFHGSPIMSC